MHWWSVAGSAAAAGMILGCGLGLAGTGDVAAGPDAAAMDGGGDEGESAEGSVTSDATAADGSIGDDTGPGMDASVDGGLEAGVDAPADTSATDVQTLPDAGCTGVTCNGACTAAADCSTCPGAPLLCAATRMCGADCGACGGNPIECFACDSNRQNPIGTCEPDQTDTYCLDSSYDPEHPGSTGEHCGCTTAADCPGDTQVCIKVGTVASQPFACFTCGEAYTQTSTCKNGGKCNQPQANCN